MKIGEINLMNGSLLAQIEKSNSIKNLNTPVDKKDRNPEVEEAAKKFETIFLSQFMTEIFKTAGSGMMGEGLQGDIFQTLFIQQLSDELSEGKGTGLSDVLYNYFARGRLTPLSDIIEVQLDD